MIDYYYAAFGIARSKIHFYMLTWKDVNNILSNEPKTASKLCK